MSQWPEKYQKLWKHDRLWGCTPPSVIGSRSNLSLTLVDLVQPQCGSGGCCLHLYVQCTKRDQNRPVVTRVAACNISKGWLHFIFQRRQGGWWTSTPTHCTWLTRTITFGSRTRNWPGPSLPASPLLPPGQGSSMGWVNDHSIRCQTPLAQATKRVVSASATTY